MSSISASLIFVTIRFIKNDTFGYDMKVFVPVVSVLMSLAFIIWNFRYADLMSKNMVLLGDAKIILIYFSLSG